MDHPALLIQTYIMPFLTAVFTYDSYILEQITIRSNDLPAHVTAVLSLAVFRQRFKTFLFSSSYPDHLTYKLRICLLYLRGPSNNFIIQANLKILMMMMKVRDTIVSDWVKPLYRRSEHAIAIVSHFPMTNFKFPDVSRFSGEWPPCTVVQCDN